MNYKKFNIISDVYFILISILGLSYIGFVIIAGQKIVPAFLMQIIFLIDAIKSNHFFEFISSNLFLINSVAGMIWMFLFFKIIKSGINSFKRQRITNNWLKKINSKKNENLYIFKSKEKLIFTAGFLNPKIFLSNVLDKTHTKQEMMAMIEHESNHKENFHPAKLIIIDFINKAIVGFPFKKWLFENYRIVIEIASDTKAENKIMDKKPIISALIKFNNNSNSAFNINGFNSQSERIKILLGKKKLSIKLPVIYLSFIFTLLFTSNSLITNNNIFFECKHLIDCVKEIVTNNDKHLLEKFKETNEIIPSSHCQKQVFDSIKN